MPRRRRLLLVEDDRVLRRACEAGLTRRGYAVTSAENGAIALERALAESFDQILLDLQLPRMNGLDMLEVLRRQRPDSPPVLVLSNSSAPDSADQAHRLGVAGFLVKSDLSLDALAARVADLTDGAV